MNSNLLLQHYSYLLRIYHFLKKKKIPITKKEIIEELSIDKNICDQVLPILVVLDAIEKKLTRKAGYEWAYQYIEKDNKWSYSSI